MAKQWHKKHISTKWGVGVLGVLLLGLIIAISQLNKTQNIFGMAYNSENSAENKCIDACNRSKQDACDINDPAFDSEKCDKARAENQKCRLGCTQNGIEVTVEGPFIENVDYIIAVSKGTLRLAVESPNSSRLERMKTSFYPNKITYRLQQRGSKQKDLLFVKQFFDAKIEVLDEWQYRTQYKCTPSEVVPRECRYDAAEDFKDGSPNRCEPNRVVDNTGGFIKEGYCPGGKNYRCCVTSVENSLACQNLKDGAYCEVVKDWKKNNKSLGSYSTQPVCPGSASVKCWLPNKLQENRNIPE